MPSPLLSAPKSKPGRDEGHFMEKGDDRVKLVVRQTTLAASQIGGQINFSTFNFTGFPNSKNLKNTSFATVASCQLKC
jgi:hypothetical protein